MKIDFDPAKDAENREKHGVSLTRAVDMVVILEEPDTRDLGYDEDRWRAWGFLDGKLALLAFTIRGEKTWAISLRFLTRAEVARLLRRMRG